YKAIREQQMKKYNANIAKAQVSMRRLHKKNPTRDEIWKGIRHKDLSRETWYFLTMLTHDDSIDKPELWEQARCRRCQTTESSTHILTECQCNRQEVIWNLAKEIWEKKGYQWRKPDLGDILTCALPKFSKNKNGQGDSRLYQILISESARLVWLIRNNRVINKRAQEMSAMEVKNQWIAVMDKQLTLDWDMMHPRFEKKALPKNLGRGPPQ
ncbi:hypothetical protein BT96DRAFT_816583, partial [Gymnopus androsaceus JB14]